ncbi:hypothetical protein ACQP2T_27065 [Nonomuraea sp. CA-143628]|uniref:hypothetical protein n=1 Tax=Nonomuraea sp. CA-143628 TaxID=3239997 RepID=UPI003D8CA40C
MDYKPMLFKNGEWLDAAEAHAEMTKACEAANGDSDEGLRALGFDVWTRIGDTELGLVDPIAFTIYKRIYATPTFYISIDGQESSYPDELYVESVIDLMDLLARWAPGLQAAAVVSRGPRVET